MSIIQSIKDYIITCPYMEQFARIYVENADYKVVNYSIEPTSGTKIIEEYLNGDSLRQFHFNINSTKITVDEASRIDNNEFNEKFSDWLETNNKNNVFPFLDSFKKPTKIEALNAGFLIMADESGTTGVYQLPCLLTYVKKG